MPETTTYCMCDKYHYTKYYDNMPHADAGGYYNPTGWYDKDDNIFFGDKCDICGTELLDGGFVKINLSWRGLA